MKFQRKFFQALKKLLNKSSREIMEHEQPNHITSRVYQVKMLFVEK